MTASQRPPVVGYSRDGKVRVPSSARWMAAALCMVAGPGDAGAVFFVDNFVNDDVTRSDSHPGFWATHTESAAGSIRENIGNDNLLTLSIGDVDASAQGVAIYSAPRSAFDFFRAAPTNAFTVRRIDMSGTAAPADRIFRFDILAESGATTSFDSASDGIRIEVRADGNVRAYKKIDGTQSTIGSYQKAQDVYPNFIRLRLKQRGTGSFELKLYYPDAVASIETIKADHGIDKGAWGDGSGATAVRLEARREGTAALTHKVTITDIYVQDVPDDHVKTTPPPGVSPTDEYYLQGMLNVQNPPYNCVGDGSTDNSIALQSAINDAIEHNLILYIPRGTYVVSRTMYFMQKVYLRDQVSDGELGRKIALNLGGKVHTVIGERPPFRPVIKLVTAEPFTNRAAVNYWNQTYIEGPNVGTDRPQNGQANIGYNNTFRNLIVDVGGVAGAFGIEGSMAQGTSFQDIKVIATGAKAGLHRLCGVAGGYYNIEIEGGQYGIYVPGDKSIDAEYPTINGLVLRNQTASAILYNGPTPLTIAGFHVVKNAAPAITLSNAWHLSSASLAAVGGIIEYASQNQGEVLSNPSRRVCYFRDVYVKNAAEVSAIGAVPLNGLGWGYIAEYALNGYNARNVSRSILDGTVVGAQGAETIADTVVSGVAEPSADIVLRHAWDPLCFPDFSDPDVANLKTDFGAVGNGAADDFDAFTNAIARAEKIYLPRGSYHCREPITLGADTKLFGAGIASTSIDQAIQTVDSKLGTAILSQMRVPGITWRVGRDSMIRNVSGGTVRASGSGGGRWFGVYPRLSGSSQSVLVSGTTEPLHIYNMNVERIAHEPQSEIRDSRNVFVYGLKGENTTGGGLLYATVLKFSGCTNVALFGYGGVCQCSNDHQLVTVSDCADVVAANVNNLPRGNTGGDTLNVWHGGGKTAAIPFDDACAALRHGNLDLVSVTTKRPAPRLGIARDGGLFSIRGFRFRAGDACVLECSPNLIDWEPMTEGVAPSGPILFYPGCGNETNWTVAADPGLAQEFFRVRWSPGM